MFRLSPEKERGLARQGWCDKVRPARVAWHYRLKRNRFRICVARRRPGAEVPRFWTTPLVKTIEFIWRSPTYVRLCRFHLLSLPSFVTCAFHSSPGYGKNPNCLGRNARTQVPNRGHADFIYLIWAPHPRYSELHAIPQGKQKTRRPMHAGRFVSLPRRAWQPPAVRWRFGPSWPQTAHNER